MNFAGKKVLVVGMGKSGTAAAGVLARQGARVSACDQKAYAEIDQDLEELKDAGVIIYTGEYPEVSKENYDLLVASPGISLEIKPFQDAMAKGIDIIGELELAYQLKKPDLDMYAITGTNGKTTTTSILQAILEHDGRNSVSGGNIGTAMTQLVEIMENGVITVEVSSFQLETIKGFRPHICGILNITPDHLDRHKNMDAYISAKMRIFENQDKSDFAVLNCEDTILKKVAETCPATILFFSNIRELQEGAFIDNKGMITVIMGTRRMQICNVKELILRGQHNMENVLCAVLMSVLAGVKPEVIAHVLKSFKGVRHRMEVVTIKNNIHYINDSKATNPDSAIKALESFEEPIVLIAGGYNKHSDYSSFAHLVKNKVRELVLVGETRKQIRDAVMDIDYTNIHEVEDFESAVYTAAKLAQPGDVVLLSPACASWDMFKSYEERGDLFCNLIKKIVQVSGNN